MRKIILQIDFDTDLSDHSFEFVDAVLIKEGDKPVVKFKEKVPDDPLSKYTAAQREKILRVNSILLKNGQLEMTEEEINYMLDPEGFIRYCSSPVTAEELQYLSGYMMKRIAVPISKLNDK